ncbi:hypothetical protein [Micromonospora sp. NPDC049497]|uniref:hypothetical protein n=1 Tax=Micromonospora sp. NPDC049497 TaxID=3364273 RepID=UPI0037B01CCB
MATGVAGLTGVVGLAALGGVAARDDESPDGQRQSDSPAATARQNVSDAGPAADKADESGADKGGEDWSGADWQGRDGKGKDGKDKDDHGPAKEVPCDTDVLVEAVNRANEDNGGVFKLAKDCEYKFTEQTDNNAFPAIDERIVLIGHNSKLVHDGSELFRFFEVLSGGDLTLKDLTLKGGQVTGPPPLTTGEDGGALLVQEGGQATLKHTKLVDNRATGTGNSGRGGAIANFGDVDIYDSKLANNHARGVGESGGSGGAIYNEGDLTVKDTEITHNTATGTPGEAGGHGGGIANEDNGTATIAYSQITNNKASGDGGGIHNDDDARLTVTRTKITGNVACDSGGGIWNDDSAELTLEYVFVVGNKATDDGGGLFHDSGAVVKVEHSKFLDNVAGDNGGGIYNGERMNVSDTEFKGNHAEEGGAIYNETDGVLTIHRSTIVYNFAAARGTATTGAGGIFNANGTVTLDNKTTIKKNEPRNCVDVPGCAN